MGSQNLVRFQYEKLSKRNEKNVKCGRHIRVKKMNVRLKGFRTSRSRKFTLKVFSVVWPGRIARVYDEIVKRLKLDEVYPNIVFCTQWGLPVLSHSSVKFRETVAKAPCARSCIK